jgi:hypothetical protein
MVGFQPSPTYIAGQILPATPVAPPRCPTMDFSLPLPTNLAAMIANYKTTFDRTNLAEPILGFLNQGGAPDKIIQAMEKEIPNQIIYIDLTNDGQPELILTTIYLSILGCDPGDSGHYIIIDNYFDTNSWSPPDLFALRDLNMDGVPELLLISRAFGGFSSAKLLEVFEWNGKSFHEVIGNPPNYPYRMIASIAYDEANDKVYGIDYEAGRVELQDIDRNGTTEIIVYSNIPFHPDLRAHGPWRGGKDILTWNSDAFVLLKSEINPPVYRFQAVEDADQAVLIGNYKQALTLYQEAIFSDLMKGWSTELYQQQFEQDYLSLSPTLTPYPAPTEEYYHLAAYARFRIMVLFVLQGYVNEAQTVYDSMVNKFSDGQPSYEAVSLATSFWQEYQSTKDVGTSCNLAINSNPDQIKVILDWLSSDYHGWQAPNYKPVDLCPFGQTSKHLN